MLVLYFSNILYVWVFTVMCQNCTSLSMSVITTDMFHSLTIKMCVSDVWSYKAVGQRNQASCVHHWDDGRLLWLPGDGGRLGGRSGCSLHLWRAVWHPRPAGERHHTLYSYIYYMYIFCSVYLQCNCVEWTRWLNIALSCWI